MAKARRGNGKPILRHQFEFKLLRLGKGVSEE